jgi:hypothetical protein
MAGRFDQRWQPVAAWACLTGMAQIALVWLRLNDRTPEPRLAEAAGRVIGFLEATHDLASRNGGLRGGVRGSFPVSGDYHRYRVLNWATKFFLDALTHPPAGAPRARFRG